MTSPRDLDRTLLVLAGLRIFAALLWLGNLLWKLPPDFGRDDERGLLYSFELAAAHAVGPLRDVASDLLIPHFTLFGWLVVLAEATIGVLLLLGVAARAAALLGLAQAVAITLLVAPAPDEWKWGYLMLIAIHAVLALTPCAERLAPGRRLRAAR